MADPKEVLHKIRESQSLMAEPDPEELTLQLRFTVLHVVGIVTIAAVACWVATALKPPTKAATLGVSAALLLFGVLCFIAGALVGRYTAIRGRWWEVFGKHPYREANKSKSSLDTLPRS